jgi:hypothetical protein
VQTPFDQYAVEAQRIALRQALEIMAKAKEEPGSGMADQQEHPAAA